MSSEVKSALHKILQRGTCVVWLSAHVYFVDSLSAVAGWSDPSAQWRKNTNVCKSTSVMLFETLSGLHEDRSPFEDVPVTLTRATEEHEMHVSQKCSLNGLCSDLADVTYLRDALCSI